MPLSSNTLFHFTNSPLHLYNILRSDFIPHYSLEYDVLVPMVCFCDIPLSQVKNHVDLYGGYGIGLTKEWGIRNHLNPVIYLERRSILKRTFNTLNQLLNNQHNDILSNFSKINMYMKPYEGIFSKEGRPPIANYNFYNEREWRFVPEDSQILIQRQYNLERDIYDERLENRKLIFTPNDIKYIILQDETEIDEMIREIPLIKAKFDEDSIKRLISRILTYEQIKYDF